MAFAPLQKFPNEYKKSDEITKKLENSMIDILNKSKSIKKHKKAKRIKKQTLKLVN